MARKDNRKLTILRSTKSGHSYHTRRNTKTSNEKLELMKYDPIVREHALYKEKK
ncbi:MAG: 50S ribosomal protein L33 [Candidatus Margulisiibacteriota bacterium]|jgi:large subunit ribosomal protein L33